MTRILMIALATTALTLGACSAADSAAEKAKATATETAAKAKETATEAAKNSASSVTDVKDAMKEKGEAMMDDARQGKSRRHDG